MASATSGYSGRRDGNSASATVHLPPPTWRKLRIFSYDPSLASQHGSMGSAVATLQVPWEAVNPGPAGEYVQVVDIDPSSDCAYAPVDLNDAYCLAADGHDPSESNPLFHQQMVYAVAMSTIGHFERALGRVALWSDYHDKSAEKKRNRDAPKNYSFVRRLRIYPHALRDQNAYYSSAKKAVLFGYFPAESTSVKNVPGTLVFTCLSHDIIAHEVTHALLDGVHHYFSEPVNVDVLAFHEAFADIVAIFQHFSYPGILRSQVARTRGDLERESLLGQLAQQFGDATGRGDALRSYLGERDPATAKWRAKPPDPALLQSTHEPHLRGAILVAAVFGAFVKVYNRRSADLYRIATEGSGVLRPGEIHPDLVDRLADEAQKVAEYMLQMCVRALDYCPPVGVTFGDFLRGAITGDYDYFPDDRYGYRVALIESFREWGIFPHGIRSMSVESLLWPSGEDAILEAVIRSKRDSGTVSGAANLAKVADEKLQEYLRDMFYNENFRDGVNNPNADLEVESNREEEVFDGESRRRLEIPRNPDGDAINGRSDRFRVWKDARNKARQINNWIYQIAMADPTGSMIRLLGKSLGFIVSPEENQTDEHGPRMSIRRVKSGRGSLDLYRLKINSVRTATRRDRVRAWPRTDLVFEIVQTRDGYFDKDLQRRVDNGAVPPPEPDFKYRAGCTLLIDPELLKVRRVIKTEARVDDEAAFNSLRGFIEQGMNRASAFAPSRSAYAQKEQFAVLHSHEKGESHGW
jgi:hypothetical protein